MHILYVYVDNVWHNVFAQLFVRIVFLVFWKKDL